MKTAEEIYPYLENEESSIGIREHNQRMYDCRQAYNKGFAAAQFAAPPPASEGDMEGIAESYASKEYKKGSIEMWRAEENLMWVNRKFDFIEGFKAALATLPTREQRGEKEKFAIRFSEWLMIQCEYKNHCVWEYRGEEYTQNELIEIFKLYLHHFHPHQSTKQSNQFLK